MNRRSIFVLSIALGLAALPGIGLAQQPTPPGGFKRTLLQKVDVPGSNSELMLILAEVQPKMATGRHTHPGPETGHVLEGEMTMQIDGQPDKVLKTGEPYTVPAGVIHNAIAGDKGAKALVASAVERGKPPASPAP